MSSDQQAGSSSPSRPRILVGVDGSDDAMRAVMYALGTAERTGHDIWLVHAVDDGVLTSGWGVVYDPTILSSVGEEALAVAKLFLSDNGFPPERVRAEVLMGHPTAVLADLSEHAELCVVGRRAAGGLDRMFIGSTSLSLGASAHCPVVVISAASTPGRTGAHKRIAVAVTAPDKAKRQVEWALGEARDRQCALVVAHVITPAPTGLFAAFKAAPTPESVARARAAFRVMLEELRRKYPDVEIEGEILEGMPIEELVDQTGKIDLLVLGIHPHPVTGVSFGGPLRGILAHSLCPVCLIR
ncbi:MAG: universal stress protein [Actinobacteria bacterium]|nr:universal stress protein [Actinomycetota bacterium]